MSSTPIDGFNVLVIGGGIAGLCLAQGLRKAGVPVAVYERERDRRDRLEGYRIHIDPDGAKALHACLPEPVWRAFVAHTVDLGGFRFLDEQLRELATIEGEATGAADPTERSHAIDRVTLRELLLTGLDDAVHFDHRFERFVRAPDGAIAQFTDGTAARGTVLVGSDGVGSRVRQQYLPEARHVDTETYGVGLKLPLSPEVRGWLTPPLARGRNMIMAPVPYFLSISVFDRAATRDDSYVGSAFVARREVLPANAAELDGAGLQRVIGELIAGWHPQLRRLIAESSPESALLVPYRSSVELAPWPTTNVTLIGDAIHAMPPVGGLGGNTALRDAALLCRQLTAAHRGEANLLDAIRGYEAAMLDYGFAAVRKAQYYQAQGLRTEQAGFAGMKGATPPARMTTHDVSPRKGYDIWAELYDTSPNPVVAMDQRHTIGILAPRPGERILDAGCGTGRNFAALLAAGSAPTGLDFSPGMLAVARRRHPEVAVHEGDLQARYPFATAELDAVLCALVGEHLDQPRAAFAEMARVTRPGGRLVFSVFHPRMAAAGMQAQFLKDGVGYRLGAHPYTIADYEGWIAEAGYAIGPHHEYVADDALIATMPFLKALVGFPVLLVIEATRHA